MKEEEESRDRTTVQGEDGNRGKTVIHHDNDFAGNRRDTRPGYLSGGLSSMNASSGTAS